MSTKILTIVLALILLLSVCSTVYRYLVLYDFGVLVEETRLITYTDSLPLFESDSLMCEWADNPNLFFSENVFSELIYYSHLIPIIAVIFISFIVVWRVGFTTVSKPLVFLSVSFSIWSICDLFLWASDNPEQIMFIWSLMMPIEVIIYFTGLWLIYSFLYDSRPPIVAHIISLLALLPIAFLLPTKLNVESFNYTNCDREVVEGMLWNYVYFIEIVSILLILWLIFKNINSNKIDSSKKRSNTIMAIGMMFFFSAFMLGNIVGTFSDDWSAAQYGLLGMPIFLGFVAYLIVKYKIFSLNILAAQALVITLWFLIGSLLFVAQSFQTRVVAGITLLLVSIFGFILVRSVKREILQREEIAKLAENLKRANERLQVLDRLKSEFVSIASHQLRSPLTSIRGYASMLAEGSYGKLPKKAQEIIENVAESAKYMALSVEDYLNVSRIEAGNMKYELSDFNLKELAEKVVDEMRPTAMKKGLVMMFRSDCNGSCRVNADIGKTRQILLNLIDNSMKYTPKGTITLVAHDDVKKKKMYVSIHDTGVGMSKDTIEDIFGKFVRARNANSINVTGTGLGLYVARNMIQAMGGSITAESDGEGKGSIFRIELPLLPGKAPQ